MRLEIRRTARNSVFWIILCATAPSLTTGAIGEEQLLTLTVRGQLSKDQEQALQNLLSAGQTGEVLRAETEAAELTQLGRELASRADAMLSSAARSAQLRKRAEALEARAMELQDFLLPRPPSLGSGAAKELEDIVARERDLKSQAEALRQRAEQEEQQRAAAENAAVGAASLAKEALDMALQAETIRQSSEVRTAFEITDAVARDVSEFGHSRRQIVLPDELTEEDLRRALTVLEQKQGGAQVEVSVQDAVPENYDIEFVHPIGDVGLETVNDVDFACPAHSSEWPFNAERVAAILHFNRAVRRAAGLPAANRSRIVVIDTGLSRELIELGPMHRGLWIEDSEFLSELTVLNSIDPEKRTCVDRNGTPLGDVYGFGISEDSTDELCTRPDFQLSQLQPILRGDAESRQVYWPDHGGFVGSLALGGPSFLEMDPEIVEHIGLSIARVTRRPQGREPKEAIVWVDSRGLEEAFSYVNNIGADVVNFSMKSKDARPFYKLDNDVLLVTSAGNGSEDLDKLTDENKPATLESTPFGLIVVGGVKSEPNGKVSFWSHSAFSPTKVDIAAPAVGVRGFDRHGNVICKDGTSGAAALVSFVSATLKSLGLTRPQLIRHRIIASGRVVPVLKDNGLVQRGRVLDVPAALDLFVDRLELAADDEEKPPKLLRGYVVHPQNDPRLQVAPKRAPCLASKHGKVDLSVAWELSIENTDEVRSLTLLHRINDPDGRDEIDELTCKELNDEGETLKFYDIEANTDRTIAWPEVVRLLPTPLRRAEPIVRNHCAQVSCSLSAVARDGTFKPNEDDDEN